MPLEAVMICVDNSDFTRNGDYAPTRFDSQIDAVNLLCGAKTQQNPENAVGFLAHAGDRVEVMITPTMDLGSIIAQLPLMKISGSADILRGIQTAQLALKHRQNKNQKQRIIAFVGSPVLNTDKELETLGKNLKKNNVSLDLISFGEVEENTAKLEKLLNAVNSNDSSHMVEVPVGPKLLSDVLLSSVIVNPDGGDMGGGGGGGEGFEFGINPENDPELALALRISMEEERARQAASGGGEAAPAAEAGGAAPATAAAAPAAADAGGAAAAPAATGGAMPMATDAAVLEAMGMEDMDEELRQALLLSMQEDQPMQTEPAPAAATAPAAAEAPAATTAAAPEVAKKEAAPPAPAAAPAASSGAAAPAAGGEDLGAVDAAWFQDPSFVQELLGNLPGVDIQDPRIQNALREVGSNEEEKKDESKEGDKK